MKKPLIALVAAAMILPSAPAAADPPSWAPAYGQRDRDRQEYRQNNRQNYRQDYRQDVRYDRRDRRDDRRSVRQRVYDDRGRYVEPRRVSRNDHVWRGRDGRYHCERDNGTTGLIIGAAGGALIGRTVDTDGDRTIGTLLGAAIGGLLGREIDRGDARCR